MEEDGCGRPGGPAAPLPGLPGIAASSGLWRGPAAHVRCVYCGGAALRRPGEPFHPRGPARALLPRRGGGCPWLPRGPFLPVDAPRVMLAFAASRVWGGLADHRGSAGTQDQPYFR